MNDIKHHNYVYVWFKHGCCWFPWKISDVCLNNRRQNKRQRTAYTTFRELKYVAYSIEYYEKKCKGFYDRNRNTPILFSNIFGNVYYNGLRIGRCFRQFGNGLKHNRKSEERIWLWLMLYLLMIFTRPVMRLNYLCRLCWQ